MTQSIRTAADFARMRGRAEGGNVLSESDKHEYVIHGTDVARPIIYLSGIQGTPRIEKRILEKSGCRHRCYSYAVLGDNSVFRQDGAWPVVQLASRMGVRMIIDSGAHSFHRMIHYPADQKWTRIPGFKGKSGPDAARHIADKFLSMYMDWLARKWMSEWDWVITFDWKKDCPLIWDVTEKIREAGVPVVPVYHGDQSVDWFRRYIDAGYPIICVGYRLYGGFMQTERRRQYLDLLFNEAVKHGVHLHALAGTGDIMLSYPWYSVDSASWLKSAAYGRIIIWREYEHRIATVHVSNRFSGCANSKGITNVPKAAERYVAEIVRKSGFNWEQVRDSVYARARYNAWVYVNQIRSGSAWTAWDKLL